MPIPVLFLAAAAAAQSPAAISDALGAALQADSTRALTLLDGLDPGSLSSKDQATVICMRQRLGPTAPAVETAKGITGRALAIYRGYWVAAMARPQAREAEEGKLADALRALLGAPGGTDMNALEPILAKAIEADGYHSLEGRTGLLRELMVWSKQDSRTMRVVLPEGEREVRVELLDGFTSFGWSNYATCGRASTGGWTTDDALFAVVPRYASLDGEEFRVSFLGHEAQHFADKARFKDLKAWELEYRAKLTELAQAKETRAKVLDKFIIDQGDDPASPHSYANRNVLNDLVERLRLKDAAGLAAAEVRAVQAAAIGLLREDTRRRTARRQTVRGKPRDRAGRNRTAWPCRACRGAGPSSDIRR